MFNLKEQFTEDCLFLNTDVIFEGEFNRMGELHCSRGELATLFTHMTSYPYDVGILIADKDGVVEK